MKMLEQKLEVRLPDGAAEAFLYQPDDIGTFPGVVFLTDLWGIRPANQAIAKRLAERGFAVLVPNVFFRHGRLPLVPPGFEFKMGEERSMTIMQALFASLTAAQMTADGPVYVDFLKRQKGVMQGKVGIVGYCFTGAMAMRMAAAAPDDIAAAASFHGGRLVTPDADSPHLLLPKIKSRLYFGHAVEDNSMTAEQIATLEASLRDWHGAFQSETYEGALHGWTVPGRAGVYNELQAERAFEKLVELFDATLK
jgi:carboxymethylenebutenolidase